MKGLTVLLLVPWVRGEAATDRKSLRKGLMLKPARVELKKMGASRFRCIRLTLNLLLVLLSSLMLLPSALQRRGLRALPRSLLRRLIIAVVILRRVPDRLLPVAKVTTSPRRWLQIFPKLPLELTG